MRSACAIMAFTLITFAGSTFAQIRPIAAWFSPDDEKCKLFYVSTPQTNRSISAEPRSITQCVRSATAELKLSKYDNPSGGSNQGKTVKVSVTSSGTVTTDTKGWLVVSSSTTGGVTASTVGEDPKAKPPEDTIVHTELESIYQTYKNLKQWYQVAKNPPKHKESGLPPAAGQVANEARAVDLASLEADFGEFSQLLHDKLDSHGLLKAFSAELMVGFAFTSVSAQAAIPESVRNATNTALVDNQSQQPEGYVQWETLHFGSESQHGFKPDIAFNGNIGFKPALTLINATDKSQTSTNPDNNQGSTTVGKSVGPLATFQQAFVWDIGVSGNFRTSATSETGIFARRGQTILTSVDTLLGQGAQSTTTSPAQNNVGRAEGTTEFGVKGSIFGEWLDIRHVDTSVLTPMVWAEVGIRHDSRFRSSGVLDPSKSFYKPEWRTVFSVMIDALQVVKRGSNDSPFSLTLQVDYETARHKRDFYVPSGTRVFLAASTDILKLFQKKQDKQ